MVMMKEKNKSYLFTLYIIYNILYIIYNVKYT